MSSEAFGKYKVVYRLQTAWLRQPWLSLTCSTNWMWWYTHTHTRTVTQYTILTVCNYTRTVHITTCK